MPDMKDHISKNPDAPSKDWKTMARRHLVFVAPSSLSGKISLSSLFGGVRRIDTGGSKAPQYFSPATDCHVTDLSSLQLADFNLAMLSAHAGIALFLADASAGLEDRLLWGKFLACMGAIPDIILGVTNLPRFGNPEKPFLELKKRFLHHGGNRDCGRITCVPLDLENTDGPRTARPAALHGASSLKALLDKLSASVKTAPDKADVQTSDQFAVHICWAADKPMMPGRTYLMNRGEELSEARISALKHKINPATLEHQAAKILTEGEIGYANISLAKPVAYSPFRQNRAAGSFTLHDATSGECVAFGLIKHALRRATNLKWHELQIGKSERAAIKGQKPCVLWFTGLSASGKSTIASLVDKKLHALGKHTYLLDGDNIRHGLCRDLGFTAADRIENQRRIAETAKLFTDAGLIVLVAIISPFRAERRAARRLFGKDEFMEVYVNTPLEICESRDPKGLYRKARSGLLNNFTGLDSPYEPPQNAEIVLPGDRATPEELADMVLAYMAKQDIL